MIRGIIFDMDGLIADTEFIHCKCYLETLKKYNISINEEYYYDFWTRQGKDIKDFILQNNLNLDPEKVREEKREIYMEKLKTELNLYDGSDLVIKNLYLKFPLALVTNSYRRETNVILDSKNLTHYFITIIARDNLQYMKPHPEGFLLASQRLDIDSNNLVVIEDSERGIISAHKAGMKSIAIPNRYTKNNDFSLADIVLKSIKEVTIDLILSL